MEIGKIAIGAAAMIEAGDVEAAQTQIVDRLRDRPEDPLLWAEAGYFLQHIGNDADALGCLERAWALGGRDIRIPYYLGVASRSLGLPAEAEGHFRQALAFDDRYGDAWHHLGLTLAHQGRFTDALDCFEAAGSRLDDGAGLGDRVWRTRFLAGDWDGAWAQCAASLPDDLEARWRQMHGTGHRQWRGESLAGQEIVLFSHGGNGDTIHYFRYLDQVLAAGPERITLIVQPALVRLVLASPIVARAGAGRIRIMTTEGALEDRSGYFMWFEGLALLFRAKPETMAPWQPYLAPLPARADHWATRLGVGEGPRIGLVWRGSPAMPEDRWRSIPLDQFLPLFALPGCRWVALQQGPLPDDEAAMLARAGVTNLSAALTDFSETAAIAANLDLIITIDSAPAHLAGALGRPVWMLNRATSEWRWGWKQTRSFWYPTMQIFNQDQLGDWAPAIAAVRAALAAR
ncbi:MAG TPA: tetratricopeptide repeat-containing glycosyltransferase family protein [Aliidongia sp.]|nr:tetratricopeptide repeat-containing glycosyltransferase family protein [Aliidongia sp.]